PIRAKRTSDAESPVAPNLSLGVRLVRDRLQGDCSAGQFAGRLAVLEEDSPLDRVGLLPRAASNGRKGHEQACGEAGPGAQSLKPRRHRFLSLLETAAWADAGRWG